MLLPIAARGQVKQQSFPVRSNVISVQLESDKPVYRVGEPIRLRLRLTNLTSQEIYAPSISPYDVGRIAILDAGGVPVPLSTEHFIQFGYEGDARTTRLDPGKPVVMYYNDPTRSGEIRDWADIRQWEYSLTQPGNYTITASVKLGAFGEHEPQFVTTAGSNEVRITILK
ncbi:MAG: hypothetical protein WAN39_02520 [Candidatus Cybelea sp.]